MTPPTLQTEERVPLALHVPEIRPTPRRFQLVASADWWDAERSELRDPESRLAEPLALDFEAYRLGRRLLLRGSVRGVLELACGRCLELYRHPVDERLELLLEPLPSNRLLDGPPEGGIELDPEDLEIGRYAGEELDLSVVLRELLAFAWPMQPRCTEACLGLCPSCGVDKNRETCGCEEAEGNRPFAALAELLERSKLRSGS